MRCLGGAQMAKGKGKKKAETIFLVCEETGDYNYTLRRKSGGEKLKRKKYCPRLRKHTLHVEKKKERGRWGGVCVPLASCQCFVETALAGRQWHPAILHVCHWHLASVRRPEH